MSNRKVRKRKKTEKIIGGHGLLREIHPTNRENGPGWNYLGLEYRISIVSK
jgi:hypothetical protein